MVVNATSKTALQRKSIKSVPFTNVFDEKVFKTAHHAMTFHVPNLFNPLLTHNENASTGTQQFS